MAYPSDLGIVVIVVTFGLTLLSFCFVAARLYTRINVMKLPGADDYVAFAAWVMLLVYSAFLTDATVHGLGAREDRPDIFKFVEMYKMVVIGQSFSYVGVAASKSAVALFLLRIVVETWHQVVLWIIVVVISTVSLLSAIFTFARCRPVEANWSPFVGGECLFEPLPFTRMILAASIVSVICDIALVVLPWVILYGLQMNKSEKRLIGCALSFGLLAAIAGVVRSITIGKTNTENPSVLMYIIVKPLLWCATELCVTICASCVPILRPLWRSLRGEYSSKSCGTTEGTSRHAQAHSSAQQDHGIELADKRRTIGSHPSKSGKPSASVLDDARLSDESILLQGSATARPSAVERISNCGTSVESMPMAAGSDAT